MPRLSVRRRATVLQADAEPLVGIEQLAGEEPLEIRLAGEPFTVTMRTPGDDFDLVAGFLVAEGLVSQTDSIESIRYARSPQISDENRYNVVDVALAAGSGDRVTHVARQVVTTSACGVCGTSSIDQVHRRSAFGPDLGDWQIPADLLRGLPDRLRTAQELFERTGGVHAAGLFDAAGELLCLREDVGRHNAVDKVVGWAVRSGRLPLRGTVLQVSGRASFELVQKAQMAGIGMLSAVSAPSSLAADLADESRITLAGFSRGDRVTVYTHPARVRS